MSQTLNNLITYTWKQVDPEFLHKRRDLTQSAGQPKLSDLQPHLFEFFIPLISWHATIFCYSKKITQY